MGPWQMVEDELWFDRQSRDCFLRFLYVQRFGANGPPLGRTLALRYDDNSLINGSPLNQCVVNATRGKATHPWAGNIYALRSEMKGASDWYSNAIIEEDLEPVVRFLEDYGK